MSCCHHVVVDVETARGTRGQDGAVRHIAGAAVGTRPGTHSSDFTCVRKRRTFYETVSKLIVKLHENVKERDAP